MGGWPARARELRGASGVFYDVASGHRVFELPLPASTEAPATPVDDLLLVPMGNFIDGSGGGLTAYALH